MGIFYTTATQKQHISRQSGFPGLLMQRTLTEEASRIFDEPIPTLLLGVFPSLK